MINALRYSSTVAGCNVADMTGAELPCPGWTPLPFAYFNNLAFSDRESVVTNSPQEHACVSGGR